MTLQLNASFGHLGGAPKEGHDAQRAVTAQSKPDFGLSPGRRNRGGKGKGLCSTSKEETALGTSLLPSRPRRPTVSRGPKPDHRSPTHILPALGGRQARSGGDEEDRGKEPPSDLTRRGDLRAAAATRRRLTTRVVEAAGQSTPANDDGRDSAAASPRRAAAPDPRSSSRKGATEASPPPSRAAARADPAANSGGGEGGRWFQPAHAAMGGNPKQQPEPPPVGTGATGEEGRVSSRCNLPQVFDHFGEQAGNIIKPEPNPLPRRHPRGVEEGLRSPPPATLRIPPPASPPPKGAAGRSPTGAGGGGAWLLPRAAGVARADLLVSGRGGVPACFFRTGVAAT
nr:translation initiation factor IF-2 [Aegilops tauschii subsp. strangulata]